MKTVVFDWNGTLLADSTLCWRATNDMLQALGKKSVSLARYREAWSIPLTKMYEDFGCHESEITPKHLQLWYEKYKRESLSMRLRRGARETLNALQHKGYARVILSNYVVAEIEEQIERLGIASAFDTILANDLHATPMKKGKVGRLEAYLEKQNTIEGLIVGDTLEEIEIARAHGLASVAITNGVCATARLKQAKPDYLIQSLETLPQIADEVFGAKREVA